MVLIDTSAWVEWLIDSPTGNQIAPCVPDPSEILVPTIVQLELYKWFDRVMGEAKANDVISFTENCEIINLDTETALEAAGACREHGLSTADAVIFATAQAAGATLLTCDSHFSGLPSVNHIEKILN